MRKLLLMSVAMASLALWAAEAPFRIAKWQNNAKCAVSFTFDDGLLDQYTLAFPVMKELGLRGTFWVVGSKIDNPAGFRSKVERNTPTMTSEQLKEMAAAGQEISSHGFGHAKLGKMTNDEIKEEVEKNKKVLMEKIGVKADTFAYPYNTKKNKAGESIVEFVESLGMVGSRTSQISLGNGRGEKAKARIEKAKSNGDWLVFMTHGVARGYDSFKEPEELFVLFRWASSQKDDIWFAPFRECAIYEKLRENTTLEINEEQGFFVITPHVANLDAALFVGELTLLDKEGNVVAAFNPFAGSFKIPKND